MLHDYVPCRSVLELASIEISRKIHFHLSYLSPSFRPTVQVLTAAKRAEIRARKHEIDLQEKQAKKKMKRMDDEDGMLAAAESMPLPSPLPSLQPAAASVGVGGWTESQHPKDGKRSRSSSGLRKSEGEEDGKRRRDQDPLTAWVYDYYRDDSYTGHVSDLRQFFKGIDLQHVRFWRTKVYTTSP